MDDPYNDLFVDDDTFGQFMNEFEESIGDRPCCPLQYFLSIVCLCCFRRVSAPWSKREMCLALLRGGSPVKANRGSGLFTFISYADAQYPYIRQGDRWK